MGETIMELKEFIYNINKFNMGIIALNTYLLNGDNYVYIMIGDRGNRGEFIKREFPANSIESELENLFGELV